jgi:hypothetical protein
MVLRSWSMNWLMIWSWGMVRCWVPVMGGTRIGNLCLVPCVTVSHVVCDSLEAPVREKNVVRSFGCIPVT